MSQDASECSAGCCHVSCLAHSLLMRIAIDRTARTTHHTERSILPKKRRSCNWRHMTKTYNVQCTLENSHSLFSSNIYLFAFARNTTSNNCVLIYCHIFRLLYLRKLLDFISRILFNSKLLFFLHFEQTINLSICQVLLHVSRAYH